MQTSLKEITLTFLGSSAQELPFLGVIRYTTFSLICKKTYALTSSFIYAAEEQRQSNDI